MRGSATSPRPEQTPLSRRVVSTFRCRPRCPLATAATQQVVLHGTWRRHSHTRGAALRWSVRWSRTAARSRGCHCAVVYPGTHDSWRVITLNLGIGARGGPRGASNARRHESGDGPGVRSARVGGHVCIAVQSVTHGTMRFWPSTQADPSSPAMGKPGSTRPMAWW